MTEANGGSRIISVLEAAWSDIQRRHPDVPGVVMITGTAYQPHKKSELHLGHFGAERWASEGSRLPELFVAGELFKTHGGVSGGRRVMETLLHEGAHGVAHTRKIKDCSRQNRYHNNRFAEIARELGLTPPARPHSTIGFSEALLGDETAALWAETIAAFDQAALPYLDLGLLAGIIAGPGGAAGEGDGDGEEGGKKKGRGGARVSVVCGCEPVRKLSLTPKQLEIGGIICALCLGEFAPVDDDGEGDEG